MERREYTDWVGFGNRVRNARMGIGMTVEMLANKTFRSENFINQIESGQKSCSIHTLYQLTKALNISADELLFGSKTTINNFEDKQIILNVIDKCDKSELKVIKDIVLTLFHGFDDLSK